MKLIRLKYIILFILLSQSYSCYTQINSNLKILFFGNSITIENGMPNTFKQLAIANDKQIEITNGAIAGTILDEHLEIQSSIDKIDDENWDYVVLQLTPGAFAAGIADSKFAVLEFESLIHANDPCTQIILFMPWRFSPHPLTRIHVIQSSTISLADEINARVCPTGILWSNYEFNYPGVDLYTDLIHPTIIGSYLAACSLYSTVYEEVPEVENYFPSITIEEALICQSLTSSVILNDLSLWNIGYIAHFGYSIQNNSVKFSHVTSNASYYLWDFGDNTSSMEETTVHQYSDTGNYDVQLIIKSDTCFNLSDTITKSLRISNIDVPFTEISIGPNPFINQLYINLKQNYDEVIIEVFDLRSKKVFSTNYYALNKIYLDLSGLASGSYLLTMKLYEDDVNFLSKKIIKVD